MPLPKSASIGARATEVYSETCSMVMRLISSKQPTTVTPADSPSDDEDPVLKQVLSFVPFLRQLLTCCACAGIAQDSMTSPGCGHCYCFDCQFRDPILKIQCRQCRERKGLVVEDQLRIIVKLYRELVMLLSIHFKDSPILDKEPSLQEIINEVTCNQKVSRSVLMIPPPPQYRMIPKQVTITPKKSPSHGTKDQPSAATVTAQPTPSTTTSGTTKFKSKIKKKKLLMKKAMKDEDDDEAPLSPHVVRVPTDILKQGKSLVGKSLVGKSQQQRKKPSLSTQASSSVKHHERGHHPALYPCRCGTNPGVILGDRICARKKCNCFLNEAACVNCKCRGCCNPYNEN